MAKKNVFKNKSLWKKIGLGCLAGALTIGAFAGVSALVKESEETTKIINPTYVVGGLTENGAYLETKGSLYTENAFECQGLDVELDFKSNVSYRIFFYDNENDFLSSTDKQTGNYDETTTPFNASTCRIVITPNDDEEIKWYEKSGYSNQLTISVDKKQQNENWSKNLFVSKGYGLYDNGWTQLQEGNKQNGFLFSEDINCADYSKLRFVVPQEIFNNSKTKFILIGATQQNVDFELIETAIVDNNVVFEVENTSSVKAFRIYTDYQISTTLFNTIEIYGFGK